MSGSPAERDMFSYYERYDEEGRLGRGAGMLEFARMQELIGRFLAPPPQVVRTSTARKSSPPRLANQVSGGEGSARCRVRLGSHRTSKRAWRIPPGAPNCST